MMKQGFPNKKLTKEDSAKLAQLSIFNRDTRIYSSIIIAMFARKNRHH
jgi:uncharacterized protein YjhX (UPF0386 family)